MAFIKHSPIGDMHAFRAGIIDEYERLEEIREFLETYRIALPFELQENSRCCRIRGSTQSITPLLFSGDPLGYLEKVKGAYSDYISSYGYICYRPNEERKLLREQFGNKYQEFRGEA